MEPHLLSQFLFQFEKSSPLFLLIGIGYLMARYGGFNSNASRVLSKFAFNFALPAMLFRILSSQPHDSNTADPKLLIAYFGTCFILFFIGRLFAKKILNIQPVGSAIFGTGCVFSNNGLLGLPIALAMLGQSVLPSVSMVLSFNAIFLWTLVSIVVEFSRHTGALTLRSFGETFFSVLKNPLIISIFLGVAASFINLQLPYIISEPLRLVGNSATSLSLLVVGMGLAQYGFGKGLKGGICLSFIKLFIFPGLVFCLSRIVGLGETETLAITFLASLPIGVNVYLMCCQFKAAEDIVANAMVISTAVSSLTVPLVVTLLHHAMPAIPVLIK